MRSKALQSVITVAALIIAGGLWMFFKRTKGFRMPARRSPLQPLDIGIANTIQAPHLEPLSSLRTAYEYLASMSAAIADPELDEFLGQIVATVRNSGPKFGAETSADFVSEIVDRVDDLRSILKSHLGDNADSIAAFRNKLIEVLADCDAELLHSDEWDPSIQRAISKEPTDGLEHPAILRFASSGIRRHGLLLRKQEVILAVPITTL